VRHAAIVLLAAGLFVDQAASFSQTNAASDSSDLYYQVFLRPDPQRTKISRAESERIQAAHMAIESSLPACTSALNCRSRISASCLTPGSQFLKFTRQGLCRGLSSGILKPNTQNSCDGETCNRYTDGSHQKPLEVMEISFGNHDMRRARENHPAWL
jgi:hypothetical protein